MSEGRRKPERVAVRLAALLAALAIVASACSSDGRPNQGDTGGRANGGQTGGRTGSAWALGTVSESFANASLCLSGDKCQAVQVTGCPDVSRPVKAVLDVGDPTGPNRGVLVFLSGGGGNKLWSQEARSDVKFSGGKPTKEIDQQAARMGANFLEDLRAAGYMTVQVQWIPPWLAAPQGDPVGPARLACRAATVVKYIHDHFYQRMGVSPGPLACGFCLTGNSGGATQIGYILSFYGLGSIVDAAVLTGGPPHAGLDRACLNEPGYEYAPQLDSVIDASYGFFAPQRGPCRLHDDSWAATWKRDSVDTGGSHYDLKHTRVLLLLGSEDDTEVGPHELLYEAALKRGGTPNLEQITVPGMTHVITSSETGLDHIKDWFLQKG